MPKYHPKTPTVATFSTTRSKALNVIPKAGEFLHLSTATVMLPRRVSAQANGTVSYGNIQTGRNKLMIQPMFWMGHQPPPDDPSEWDLTSAEITVKGDASLPLVFIGGDVALPRHDLDSLGLLWIGVGLLCVKAKNKKPVTLIPPPIANGTLVI